MKIIRISGYGCEVIYPAHQLLFAKYIPSADVTSIRFIHDPQTYRFDGKEIYQQLEEWLRTKESILHIIESKK